MARVAPPLRRLPLGRSLGLSLGLSLAACDGCPPGGPSGGVPSDPVTPSSSNDDPAPSLSGGPSPSASAAEAPAPKLRPSCPKGMVLVAPPEDASHRFCIDRWEATVMDDRSSSLLSPYYAPSGKKARYLFDLWSKKAAEGEGTELAKSMPLPDLPAYQRSPSLIPRASEPKANVVPQGYVSGEDARLACERAQKRLCQEGEWRRACRGQEDRDFPYGETYEQGACNVFRETHPGVLLYENPSINHTDPRFNKVQSKGRPLLRRTGQTEKCASRWGEDAIFDMVGNLDEWVDDPEGTFVGGFYARAKKDGCLSTVRSHGFDYADYSTGFRCCAAPEMVSAGD